jgi:hypothetical protein
MNTVRAEDFRQACGDGLLKTDSKEGGDPIDASYGQF